MAARIRGKLAAVGPLAAHQSVHLGERIREHRTHRQWSIGTAAAMAGLSANTLANLERSEMPNPTLSTLLALMELYELDSIEQLLGAAPSRLLLRQWVATGRPGIRP